MNAQSPLSSIDSLKRKTVLYLMGTLVALICIACACTLGMVLWWNASAPEPVSDGEYILKLKPHTPRPSPTTPGGGL